MKDIQDLMRAELGRERPKPAARARATGTPRPITIGPAWVVACFAGAKPRFLAAAKVGWSVVLDADRAQRFADEASAQTALEDYQRRHAGSSHDAGSAWCVMEMTLRATFR